MAREPQEDRFGPDIVWKCRFQAKRMKLAEAGSIAG
jgi:hypothetical protein